MHSNQATLAAPTPFLPDLCQTRAVLFVVLVAELLALVFELVDHGFNQFSWFSFSQVSLFTQWVCLLSAACLCGLRNGLSRWPWHWAAAFSYVLILLVVAMASLLSQWLLSAWSVGEWFSLSTLASQISIAALLAGIGLRYFYLTQQLRQREQAALQARIEALQARMHPHFLFNSMNTIASLITIDAEAAETAVEDLSALFRASLSEPATEVRLADELEVCQCYVRIEQARLGERLELDWQLQDLPMDLPIPSLTLQPLLENAVYHGIQQLPEGGTVIVQGCYRDQQVQLVVTNPLPPQPIPSTGHQLALENIRHRLQSLYGPKAEMQVEQSKKDYRVLLCYPVQETKV